MQRKIARFWFVFGLTGIVSVIALSVAVRVAGPMTSWQSILVVTGLMLSAILTAIGWSDIKKADRCIKT